MDSQIIFFLFVILSIMHSQTWKIDHDQQEINTRVMTVIQRRIGKRSRHKIKKKNRKRCNYIHEKTEVVLWDNIQETQAVLWDDIKERVMGVLLWKTSCIMILHIRERSCIMILHTREKVYYEMT